MDAPESADFEYLLSVSASPPPMPGAAPPAHAPPVPPPPVPPQAASPSAPSSQPQSQDAPGGGKKRPLGQEDRKVRDRKRVLRNRELARVSNERRKGRIKAMETELSDTRKTVATLEESIKCLEAENKELKNLLQGKNPQAAAQQPDHLPADPQPNHQT